MILITRVKIGFAWPKASSCCMHVLLSVRVANTSARAVSRAGSGGSA